MKSEHDVLKKFANEIAERVSRKAMKALREITAINIEADSELKNVWEELCVQLQVGQFYFWDSYDEMSHEWVCKYVYELKEHEVLALWFQTEEGREWLWTPVMSDEHYGELDDNEREHYMPESEYPPVFIDDITEYIVAEYLYDKAAGWSNKRIRAFKEA